MLLHTSKIIRLSNQNINNNESFWRPQTLFHAAFYFLFMETNCVKHESNRSVSSHDPGWRSWKLCKVVDITTSQGLSGSTHLILLCYLSMYHGFYYTCQLSRPQLIWTLSSFDLSMNGWMCPLRWRIHQELIDYTCGQALLPWNPAQVNKDGGNLRPSNHPKKARTCAFTFPVEIDHTGASKHLPSDQSAI